MISIIIPAFNSEKTIQKCIESVLVQDYVETEVMVIDDGSTDETGRICKTLMKVDARIRYLYKENGGAASARNYGLKHVHGDYIYFLDSDDVVKQHCLTHLLKGVNYAELCMTDMVVQRENQIVKHYRISDFSDSNLMAEEEIITRRDFYSGAFVRYEITLLGNVSGKLFYTSIIKDGGCVFDENVLYGEELTFVIQYMKQVSQIYIAHSEDYVYFSYDTPSLSSQTYKNDVFIRTRMADHFVQLAKLSEVDSEVLCRYYSNFSRNILNGLINIGNIPFQEFVNYAVIASESATIKEFNSNCFAISLLKNNRYFQLAVYTKVNYVLRKVYHYVKKFF